LKRRGRQIQLEVKGKVSWVDMEEVLEIDRQERKGNVRGSQRVLGRRGKIGSYSTDYQLESAKDAAELTDPSLPSQASPIPATALPSLASPSQSTSPTTLHLSAPSSKHLIASPYIPANKYISPKSFSNLPPATPANGADVYLAAPLICAVGTEPDATEEILAVDVDLVNGDERAVERRNGLEDAATVGGIGDGLVGMGGNEGGPTDVGLPPGVSARVRFIPMLDCGSREFEWGIEVEGGRPGASAVGVELRDWFGKKLVDSGNVDVSEGSNVEESVFIPDGVSSAVAYEIQPQIGNI
jgi:hypothetical protein